MGVGGQGGRQGGELSQLDVVVMETAVEGHGLAGVEGGQDLKGHSVQSEALNTIRGVSFS